MPKSVLLLKHCKTKHPPGARLTSMLLHGSILALQQDSMVQMNDMQCTQLPANLPVPKDDGACNHLRGKHLPDLALFATSGEWINLCRQNISCVLYAYPLTGRPGVALPNGWDEIPGARGCTPESCSFRDRYAEIRQLGVEVFGLSTQPTDYQREVQQRLHLPFDLLSDEDFAFTKALSLPTFTVESTRLLKRLTLIVASGVIEHVFYPIFPPDIHPADVLAYLKSRTISKTLGS